MAPPLSLFDFEHDLKLYRHSQREAGNADDHPNGQFAGSEYIAEQLRRSIGYLRLCQEVSLRGQIHRQLHHLGHLVEGAKMLSCY